MALTRQIGVPKTFVESGFHWPEFNCIGLIRPVPIADLADAREYVAPVKLDCQTSTAIEIPGVAPERRRP